MRIQNILSQEFKYDYTIIYTYSPNINGPNINASNINGTSIDNESESNNFSADYMIANLFSNHNYTDGDNNTNTSAFCLFYVPSEKAILIVNYKVSHTVVKFIKTQEFDLNQILIKEHGVREIHKTIITLPPSPERKKLIHHYLFLFLHKRIKCKDLLAMISDYLVDKQVHEEFVPVQVKNPYKHYYTVGYNKLFYHLEKRSREKREFESYIEQTETNVKEYKTMSIYDYFKL